MPSEKLRYAGAYVKELNEQLNAYQDFTKENVPPLFREQQNKRRRPPKEFHDSSFLYIRSYDADMGIRPFSGIAHWNSPDITVAPVSDTAAYTRTLEAGKTYLFNCTIRNRGDFIVPSANVELFLTDPTLGFDTRFAVKLGVTRGWVNSLGSTKVGIEYTIPGTEGGHKCLFARVFSFSPLDIPIDDYQLSPWLDRHVGQLNLNITPQSSAFSFNLVHLPNARERISFIAMDQNQLRALRHPALAEFNVIRKSTLAFVRNIKMDIMGRGQEDVNVRRERTGLSFFSRSGEGFDENRQAEISKATITAIRAINSGQAKVTEFRKLFKVYREMHRSVRLTRFAMQIPDLGLNRGEAAGFEIVNTNLLTGEVKGGITMIITG